MKKLHVLLFSLLISFNAYSYSFSYQVLFDDGTSASVGREGDIFHYLEKKREGSKTLYFYDCKSISKEDVYVRSIGFKSFVPLFYGNQKNPGHLHYLSEGWLVNGKVDKPAFFTSRSDQKDAILTSYTNLQVIYDKGGFTFYSRKDQSNIARALFHKKND